MKDILLLGDACVDRFVQCKVTKLCPEAPVPLLQIVDMKENYGMAANVYNNMLALVPSLSATGEWFLNTNREQIIKTRFVDIKTNHMFMRVDTPYTPERIKVLDKINFDRYKIVVISDYNKGFLSQKDIAFIISKHKNVFIDTKKPIGAWIKGAKYIKINNIEYEHSLKQIKKLNINNKIIQTCGGDGVIFKSKHYTVPKVGVVDVCGAGDTFLAALVVEYLATNGNINKAIEFANKCATKVVQERGVSVIKL